MKQEQDNHHEEELDPPYLYEESRRIGRRHRWNTTAEWPVHAMGEAMLELMKDSK